MSSDSGASKIMRLLGFYINRDDPRIYVYGHPRHKWLGVTLNLSHRRAWLELLVITGISMLSVIPISLFLVLFQENLEVGWMAAAIASHVLLWVVALVIYCFRAAENDLRRHGECRDV